VDPRQEEKLVTGTRVTNARSGRHGYTLIETLVVVTGVTIVLGACALTMQLLLRLNAYSHDRYRAALALERLAHQLRDDVHGCERAEIVSLEKGQGGPPGLLLQVASDHQIRYELRPGSVERNESRSGKMVRHESYSLPRGRDARFEQRDEGAARLVALVVSCLPGRSGTDPPRPLEILALPGKHRTDANRNPKEAP
jgi:hypothetical protein